MLCYSKTFSCRLENIPRPGNGPVLPRVEIKGPKPTRRDPLSPRRQSPPKWNIARALKPIDS
jgi:hypothetical protein